VSHLPYEDSSPSLPPEQTLTDVAAMLERVKKLDLTRTSKDGTQDVAPFIGHDAAHRLNEPL
jgi:hypothetical protein